MRIQQFGIESYKLSMHLFGVLSDCGIIIVCSIIEVLLPRNGISSLNESFVGHSFIVKFKLIV